MLREMMLSPQRFAKQLATRGLLFVAISVTGLWPGNSAAQAALTTLRTNGPSANRINIVLLSEGYQTNQLGQFLTDADNVLDALFAHSPFSEYTNYFNAYAVSVASVDSGSDRSPVNPPETLKNTYFNSSYNSYGLPQLLTIPPNGFDANFNNGKGKVLNLLTNLVPAYDVVVLVVNELFPGGSGDAGLSNDPPVTVVSVNNSSMMTVVHELGHTVGGLADEYTNAFPGHVPVEMPNATAETNRSLIKWRSWISESTPVPTPANDISYLDSVGLFQGAQYQATGWYRPKNECIMNHLGFPFCEVCSEQLVRSFYTLIRGIDSVTPASSNVTVATTQSVTFTVVPLQPSTHDLEISWMTNGVVVAGAAGGSLSLLPATLGSGSHIVQAVVADTTPLVIDDPFGLLKTTNQWVLDVNLPHLTLTNTAWLPDGRFRFTVTGVAPDGFKIQTSTNLASWTSVLTNVLTGGTFNFTNQVSNSPHRSYRATTPP